MTVHIQRLLPY